MLFRYRVKSLPSQTTKNNKEHKMSSFQSIKKENAEFRRILENHAEEIEHCKSVVYQLLGGLFHQKKQKWTMHALIDMLDGTSNKTEEQEHEEEEANESIWPTTRQGDNHEERMRKMEETIQKLEKQVEMMEKRQRGD